jgi:hypothetical protein
MHRKSRREKTLNLCTNEEEYFKVFVRLHFFYHSTLHMPHSAFIIINIISGEHTFRNFVLFCVFYLRYYVLSSSFTIRCFVLSTFFTIQHFFSQPFVTFDVLSVDVLYCRRFLLRRFGGESIDSTPGIHWRFKKINY